MQCAEVFSRTCLWPRCQYDLPSQAAALWSRQLITVCWLTPLDPRRHKSLQSSGRRNFLWRPKLPTPLPIPSRAERVLLSIRRNPSHYIMSRLKMVFIKLRATGREREKATCLLKQCHALLGTLTDITVLLVSRTSFYCRHVLILDWRRKMTMSNS